MKIPPRSLLFEAREERLAALENLARALWLGGMTHALGCLEPRLAALLSARGTLATGALPSWESLGWPAPPVARALHAAMARLELDRFCAGQKELTDTVLMSILFHLDFIVDYMDRGATEDRAVRMAAEAFEADWQERCGQLDELTEVFGLLPGDGKHTRWDAIRGVLRSAGWQEVLRIRRMLDRLPELARIIRALGRARQADDPGQSDETTVESMQEATALRTARETVHVPDLPGQTRGVHRSDRLARMLPAEAMLLAHPRLRLVWHARRAERTLLCYEDDDRMQEDRQREAPVTEPRPSPRPARRLEMGPLLVCVDTSGSMQGGAEDIAKAVVLEAMRTAHAQGRACLAFAFGGADELIELELAVDGEGIGRISHFLGQAFRGGTDICGLLEKVLARLGERRWQLADLLIASDGEFGATPALAARVEAVKAELGLRIQGVLIGDRETVGFMELADHIYPVRDWRRFCGTTADFPMPTQHLTAELFPGALRNRANREATVSGDVAAAMVLGAPRRKPSK